MPPSSRFVEVFVSTVIRLRINGRTVPAGTDPDRLLLWFLRGDLHMMGTKYGCGAGLCGACTVLADGHAQSAAGGR
jgi:aerobic-type carbon monoxide dehydrogenase small subunit (CoxS/CutS family)